jgi:flagellum-specific peptidoglycan hydrolase FlgJ
MKAILIILFSCLYLKDDSKNILTLRRDIQCNYGAHCDYISYHLKFALKNQERYGIPASFTLAQAIYESGGGFDALAVKNKNHFGIKASGRYKSYKSAEQSYDDHAGLMLKRYPYLLSFKIGDIWAANIASMGYVRSNRYGRDIISIIRFYNLKKYDDNEVKSR